MLLTYYACTPRDVRLREEKRSRILAVTLTCIIRNKNLAYGMTWVARQLHVL